QSALVEAAHQNKHKAATSAAPETRLSFSPSQCWSVMLRCSSAALILLALATGGLCDSASVEVRLPDDADFTKYSFAYMTISGSDLIDSVSSGLVPDKFDVDRSSVPNRIVFKADLPGGTHLVQVTIGTAIHQLSVTVSRLPLSVLDNAIFISGRTNDINSLTQESARVGCRLVSQLQPAADTSEVSLLIPKASTSSYLALWEAYELVKNETEASSGVQVMPDRCPADSAQLCRSRLRFSSSSLPSVHPAVVQLNSDSNFVGFGLSWTAQTAEQMSAEPCICPSVPNIPWGPRCEYPVRSYSHGLSGLTFTRHWIGGLPHSVQSLEISFELSGTIQQENQDAVVLKSSADPNNSLLSATFVYRKTELRVAGSLLGGDSISVDLPQQNSGSWFAVHVSVKSGLAVQLATFLIYGFDIGRALSGCVQSVRVNGYLIDMAAGREVTQGGGATIGAFCGLQNQTCSGTAGARSSRPYVCGAQSVCYGVIKNDPSAPMDCNCECLGSKRKMVETIIGSELCKRNEPWNACTKDPLIISTASSNASSWFQNLSNPLPLSDKNSASIELELRTRVSASTGVLHAVIKNSARSTVLSQSLDISDGLLQLCINSSSCLAFPPIRVDDGEWHSVFAATRQAVLKLRVDGVDRLHDLGRTVADLSNLDLTAQIANSWLRNIRVSGTYMSTTTDAADRSIDVATGGFITPVLASDARVGPDGVDLTPPCDCPSTEVCRRLWGKTTCECPAGQERDAGKSCVAVNPCSKFNISCPSGGSCRATGVNLGFECICPPGVTSRMCRVGGENTPAPSTAAVQWWVWLIIAIVVFFIIVLLILLAFVKRSRKQRGSEAPKSDIEQINQDMGDDTGNDGVPPEDYKGPLSLQFPPAQKDSNGGLPNFQPVHSSAPSGGPADPLRPIGAPPTQPVAPDSVNQEPPDAAAGDETLNYGYEDTRDDDAADLDQVSLVSADTDSSIDLRPTLDAWGPKFQSLSDILT
uniref:EGF-like domain-containing protein n=1 Tax=Macrostomum lignano TaxID=282301 RepID=A0A1I8HRW4_9PLAT